MDIPKEIFKEIRDSILEHGACGEITYVVDVEEGITDQSSDLSFCSTEYIKQSVTHEDYGCGVAYFPYKTGFIKAEYVL